MTGRLVTLGVLLACIVLLGAMFYQVVAPFLLPLLLAAILAILCRPYFLRMLPYVGHRANVAAAILTAGVTLLLVTPIVVGTFIAAVELNKLTQDQWQTMDWSRGLQQLNTQFVKPALQQVTKWFPHLVTPEQIDAINAELPKNGAALAQLVAGKTFSWASSTVGTVFSLLLAGGMFLVAFYYFLADGPSMIAAAEALIPLPLEHQRRLRDQFAKVVRAVVMATFLAAFAQGIATTLALQVVGMGHFFVFLIAATIAALVPLAGTWIVWAPCAALLAFQGHYPAAIGLAMFGIIVVSLLDNVIRTYVLNSDAQLHPLLAFVSVLGALEVMGLWGIFFGPIIASCLYALVQIFMTELDTFTLEPRAGGDQPTMPVPLPMTSAAVGAPAATPLLVVGMSPPAAIQPPTTALKNRSKGR